jgi:hypothetical protein
MRQLAGLAVGLVLVLGLSSVAQAAGLPEPPVPLPETPADEVPAAALAALCGLASEAPVDADALGLCAQGADARAGAAPAQPPQPQATAEPEGAADAALEGAALAQDFVGEALADPITAPGKVPGFLDEMLAFLQGVVGGIPGALGGAAEQAAAAVGGALATVGGAGEGAVRSLGLGIEGVGAAASGVGAAFQGAADAVGDALAEAGKALEDLFAPKDAPARGVKLPVQAPGVGDAPSADGALDLVKELLG